MKYFVNSEEYHKTKPIINNDNNNAKENNSLLENKEFIIKMNSFLNSDNAFSPNNQKGTKSNNNNSKDEVFELEVINALKSYISLKSVTNITEVLFTLGEEYIKDCGFWLKAGLVNDSSSQRYLPRHLIMSALVYSQLGQNLIAEGMHRQAIELLKNDYNPENRSNMSFCLNMYGKLLMRHENRRDEANRLLEESERIEFFNWYKVLTKLHYLELDFD